MDRRTFLKGSLAAAGALAVGACRSDSDTARPATTLGADPARLAPAERPTLRLAGADSGFPSPFAHTAGGGDRMIALYDTLLWKDSTGALLPWLASRYERTPDNLTHRFELRDNLRWSDGRPVTADDVVFTWEYTARNTPANPLYLPRGRAVAVNPRTVEITTEQPEAQFPALVAGSVPIVPQHVWSSITDPTTNRDPAVLVSTGAYRLISYTPGEGSYAYEARDEYFLGKPFVRRIEHRPTGNQLTALLAGEIDVGSPDTSAGLSPDTLAPFWADPGVFDVLEGPQAGWTALLWNMERVPALADVRVRQAFARAIDRNDIVQRVLGGLGKPGVPGFLPPTQQFYGPAETYPFDLAIANRLLDEAGYPRTGDTRRGPDGQPLRFDVVVSQPVPRVMDVLINQLKAVGVELVPQPADNATARGRMTRGDYEWGIVSAGGLVGDAGPDRLRTLLSSRVPRNTFASVRGWSNGEYDDLADRQLTLFDEAERKRMVGRMQQILGAEVPWLPLYYPNLYYITRKAVLDQWYFTPGGYQNGGFSIHNKHVYITGVKTGLTVRPTK